MISTKKSLLIKKKKKLLIIDIFVRKADTEYPVEKKF